MQYLFADGELLLVILDGLLVVSHGRVGVDDVPVGAAHACAVLQQPRDVEVRLVQLQRRVSWYTMPRLLQARLSATCRPKG